MYVLNKSASSSSNWPTSNGEVPRRRRSGQPLDVHRAIRALREKRKWFAAAAAIGIPLAVFVPLFLMPRTWEAETSVVFDGIPPMEGLPPNEMRELRTLVDSIKLPTNIAEIQRRLKLSGSLVRLAQNIDVSYDLESNLVRVAARASNRTAAKRLADMTVAVFLDHRRGAERRRLQEFVKTVESDVHVATSELSEKRSRYDRFRQEHGIADLSTERQQAIETTAELQAAADTAKAEADAQAARLRELESAARRESAMTVLSERRASTDALNLEQAKTELTSSLGRFSEEHPRVQALRAQIQVLERQSKSGTSAVTDRVVGANPQYQAIQGGVVGSLADRQAALQRETAYRALADSAQAKVRRLSAVEGQASEMLAGIRVAEAHLSQLQERRARVQDAARSPATGFRLAAAATYPEAPLGSAARYATALAIPVVIFLGLVLYILFLEFRGFRLRTPVEISFWGKGPVIGSTTWPRDLGAFDDLIHELDDYAPDAVGRTLVVGATEAEESMAARVAQRLTDDWQPTTLIGVKTRESGEPIFNLQLPAHSSVYPENFNHGSRVPPSSALAFRSPDELVKVDLDTPPSLLAEAWTGPVSGPALRRAARLADRVIVVVSSGAMSCQEIANITTRLGREQGVGYLLIGLDDPLSELPDRVGEVEEFWSTYRSPAELAPPLLRGTRSQQIEETPQRNQAAS